MSAMRMPWARRAWIAAAALALGGAAFAQAVPPPHRNVSAGGPLRHGVYGRIEVSGPVAPAVVYSHPVVAARAGRPVPQQAQPVYLYVPSGQIRRWQQHCARWQACDEPVLFVRMDAGPGRWGAWRYLRGQQVAAGAAAP